MYSSKENNGGSTTAIATEDVTKYKFETQQVEASLNVSRIPKDRGWAWMVMVGCFLVHIFIVGGAIKSFGVLYVEFMERFETGAAPAAWIIVFAQSGTLCLAPLANFFALQLSNRFIVFVGGILISLGFMLSMFATSIEFLYVTYGGLVGLGAAFAWSPSIASMGHYFSRRRALANGIAVGGSGVGNLILPPVMRFTLDEFGYQGSLLILSALMLHVCVSAFLLRPPKFYDQKGRATHKELEEFSSSCLSKDRNMSSIEKETSVIGSLIQFPFCCPQSKNTTKQSVMFDWKLLLNPVFVLYGLSAFFFFCGFPGLFIIIAPHAKAIDYSKKEAAFLLSIMGVADIVGRVGTGWFADFKLFPTPYIIVISQMITCAATVITPFVHNYLLLGALCWVNGMFTGSFMAIIPVILAESLGVQKLSSSLGLIGLFMGAGVFVSGPAVGKLKDISGNWHLSFYFSAGVLLLSALTMLCVPLCKKK